MAKLSSVSDLKKVQLCLIKIQCACTLSCLVPKRSYCNLKSRDNVNQELPDVSSRGTMRIEWTVGTSILKSENR